MNPEVSPWMLIADRQRRMEIERDQQQQMYKNQIRVQYQKQLAHQMEEQRQAKLRKQEDEKKWEKQLVNKSIENQQRIFEIQKMKAMASNERQSRLDMENETYKAARTQRQKYIQANTRQIQIEINQQAEMKNREEMDKMQRKKRELREDLKDTMDSKNHYEKFMKDREKDFQNFKIKENQMILQRDEKNRRDYLERQKQKAATIDYGSHDSFQQNHEKSLRQRKREEWERQRQYIERSKQANLSDSEYRKFKQSMENNYREELKRQLQEKTRSKKQTAIRETEQDHETIQRYQNYTKSVDFQKKQAEDSHRKELLSFLQMQVEEKQEVKKKDPYIMRDRDYVMNADVLRGERVKIPGETFQLDHDRQKQLQYAVRSLSQSPAKVEQNYLAGRGRTILQ